MGPIKRYILDTRQGCGTLINTREDAIPLDVEVNDGQLFIYILEDENLEEELRAFIAVEGERVPWIEKERLIYVGTAFGEKEDSFGGEEYLVDTVYFVFEVKD